MCHGVGGPSLNDVPVRSPLARVTAFAAVGWMTAFALLHLYWALGGTLGLPSGVEVSDRIGLLIVDILAIPFCILAAVVSVVLARTSDRPGVTALAWLACLVAFVHAAPTVGIDLLAGLGLANQTLSTPTDVFLAHLYEPLWMATAVVCGLAAGFHMSSTRAATSVRLRP